MYLEYKNLLNEQVDKKYLEFSKKLGDTIIPYLGIRIPILKKLSKEVAKKGIDIKEFDLQHSVEMQLSFYYIYFYRNKDYQKQFEFVLENINFFCCWQLTDLVVPCMEKAPFDYFYNHYLNNKNSSIFAVRFFYVYSIKYARSDAILKMLNYKEENEYYIVMAKAWLYATIAIYFPDIVYDHLINCSVLLKRKTISKICDSKRISEEIKNKYKSLRNYE